MQFFERWSSERFHAHVELKREGKVLADFDLYALLVKVTRQATYNCNRETSLHFLRGHRWRSWAACVRKQSTSCAARRTEELWKLRRQNSGGFRRAISVERIEDQRGAAPSN